MTETSETTAPIRVLLADDEPAVRAGVRLILRHAEGIDVVAEAANGAEALELAARQPVDVALVDIRMPVLDGLATIAPLRGLDPRPVVVMLTTFGDEENVTRALQSGASGFLLKDDGPQELVSAVRAAAAGDAVLSPGVTGVVVKRMLAGGLQDGATPNGATPNGATPNGNGQPTARQRVEALTEHEREALSLLGQGMPNLELSLRLGLGPDAVKLLVSDILDKTGADTRVQAALVAAEAGLVP
ncbi:response regulator transcription factor [Streptacidiphilus jiangxiensis]|uniref:DNA-binding response regulator, NarL/FixJ family, contains REC and HTH domains n=1 Tax=Streptacidiphilus jiangxiensis TaxID=235985 RepID=A0A1H7UKJ8_STRJI|nr:response regulator transcription factor [Streptacidiphilus jiangxiensis]SEL97471.1 DNA-binding response regulator, NarL/FixJ family, contains REC and HTH domains [Streptacidiphilus jiangxiensis]